MCETRGFPSYGLSSPQLTYSGIALVDKKTPRVETFLLVGNVRKARRADRRIIVPRGDCYLTFLLSKVWQPNIMGQQKG